MSKTFETMIEGDLTNDCQIDSAAIDKKSKRLYVDAHILHPDNPAVSPEGRNKFLTHLLGYARQIECIEEFGRTAVEDLCLEINDSFYNLTVNDFEKTLEAHIASNHRVYSMLKAGYDVADFKVVVTIQPTDFITAEELLKLTSLTAQV